MLAAVAEKYLIRLMDEEGTEALVATNLKEVADGRWSWEEKVEEKPAVWKGRRIERGVAIAVSVCCPAVSCVKLKFGPMAEGEDAKWGWKYPAPVNAGAAHAYYEAGATGALGGPLDSIPASLSSMPCPVWSWTSRQGIVPGRVGQRG